MKILSLVLAIIGGVLLYYGDYLEKPHGNSMVTYVHETTSGTSMACHLVGLVLLVMVSLYWFVLPKT